MTSVSNARKPATWHATAPISDALIVTIMDPCSGLPWQNTTFRHTSKMQGQHWDQHLRIIATPGVSTVTIGTGTDLVNLDPTPITLDIRVTVAVTPTKVILDHFTGPHAIALCATGAPAHTATAKRHHIADLHHAEISPEMTVDPEHINPTNTITNPHRDHLPVHNQHPGSLRIESTNRLLLVIHPQNIIVLMNRIVIQRMI